MSLKSLVKSTRAALDSKDYPQALELCDDGLRFEPDNYYLLVFRSVALQNLSKLKEAVEGFWKAVKAQPDNAVAYQGLMSLYQAESMTKDEGYFKVLLALLDLYKNQNEGAKHYEVFKKLQTIYQEERQVEKSLELLAWLGSNEASDLYKSDPSIKIPSKVDLLKQQISLLETHESAAIQKEITAEKFRMGADPLPVITERVEIKFLKVSKLDELYRELLEIGEGNEGLRETLIERMWKRIPYCEDIEEKKRLNEELRVAVEAGDCLIAKEMLLNFSDSDEIEESSQIKELTKNSPFIAFKELKNYFEKKQYERVLSAYSTLNEACEYYEQHYERGYKVKRALAGRFKFIALEGLGLFLEAFEMKLENEIVMQDEQLFESSLHVYEETKHYSLAISLIEAKLVEFAPEEPSLIIRLVKALLKAKRFEEVREYCAAVLESYSEDDSRAIFYTGLANWEEDRKNRHDKTACLEYFLKAAKLLSSKGSEGEGGFGGLVFMYLGKYYFEIDADYGRAKKCLLKALEESEGDLMLTAEIAIVLGQVYLQQSEFKRVLELLGPLSTQLPRHSLLHRVKGVAHYQLNEYGAATSSLQQSLKAEQANELECLVWLGKSYLKESRLSAALKTFTRAVEVSDGNNDIRAWDGLGRVWKAMRRFDKSVQVYERILEVGKETLLDGISRIKVLLEYSSSLKAHAANLKDLGLIGEARIVIERCLVKVLLGELKDQRMAVDLVAYWKLLADAFILAHQLKVKIEGNIGNFKPTNEGFKEIIAVLDKESNSNLLNLAAFSMMRAIEVASKESGWLWNDLAVILMKIYNQNNSEVELLKFAQAACQNGLKVSTLDSGTSSSSLNNTAAMIAWELKESSRAQHHFILSLLKEESAGVWNNLGLLYQLNGDFDLAKRAFERAILVDVDWTPALFSQLQLNEVLGLGELDTSTGNSSCLRRKALERLVDDMQNDVIYWPVLRAFVKESINDAVIITEEDSSALREKVKWSLWRLLALDNDESRELKNVFDLVVESEGINWDLLKERTSDPLIKAASLLKEKKYKEALIQLQSLPKESRLKLLMIAECQIGLGNYKEAFNVVEGLVKDSNLNNSVLDILVRLTSINPEYKQPVLTLLKGINISSLDERIRRAVLSAQITLTDDRRQLLQLYLIMYPDDLVAWLHLDPMTLTEIGKNRLDLVLKEMGSNEIGGPSSDIKGILKAILGQYGQIADLLYQ